jgi:hypothetical protein
MVRWMRHVVRMREFRNASRKLVGKLEEKNHLGDLGVYRRMILKLTLKEQDMKVWIQLIWLNIGASGGLLQAL